MGRRLLCCWKLRLLILLTLTVILRLISLDAWLGQRKLYSFVHVACCILSGGGLWLTAAR